MFSQVYKRKQKPAVDRLCVGIPRGEVKHGTSDHDTTFYYISPVRFNLTFVLVVFWIAWRERRWKNEHLQDAHWRFSHHQRRGLFSWKKVR